jgi:hypothetical protein
MGTSPKKYCLLRYWCSQDSFLRGTRQASLAGAQMFDLLQQFGGLQDQPFGSPSSISPTHQLASAGGPAMRAGHAASGRGRGFPSR